MSDENPAGPGFVDTPPATPDEEELVAGARLHGAVQVIGTASPPAELPSTPPPPRMPQPLVPSETETVDLFGASATPVEAPTEAPPRATFESPASERGLIAQEPAAHGGKAEHVEVDLRSDETGPSVTIDAAPDRSYLEARQGWVRSADGGVDWRTVATTADRLDAWETDIPLGVVAADVMLFGPVTGDRVARSRDDAFTALAAQAAQRGGHAVISITQQVTQLDHALLVTAVGSVVTLRSRSPRSR